MKNQCTTRVVAVVRAEEEVSLSGEETAKRKSRKTKKEKVQEKVAVLEKQPPPVPVPPIKSPPQAVNPIITAPTQQMSNAATYGSSGGEQRRGRGKYDSGRNYNPPAEMSVRRNEENSRFLGACYVCEETGHRANRCPRRECFACHQVGHIASDCPLRPPRPPPNVSCQVCGQAGVVFANCPNCAYRRTQWGNERVQSDQFSGFPSSVPGTLERRSSPVVENTRGRGAERVEVVSQREYSQLADQRAGVGQQGTSKPTPGRSETPPGDNEPVE